jgi:hypothetical protein
MRASTVGSLAGVLELRKKGSGEIVDEVGWDSCVAIIGVSLSRGGFVLQKRVKIVARCGALWRGAGGGIGLEVDLAAEFGLEAGVLFPAGDGVRIDAEGGGDGGDGLAGEEKAGGGELVGVEGFLGLPIANCGLRIGGLSWVRFAQLG